MFICAKVQLVNISPVILVHKRLCNLFEKSPYTISSKSYLHFKIAFYGDLS